MPGVAAVSRDGRRARAARRADRAGRTRCMTRARTLGPPRLRAAIAASSRRLREHADGPERASGYVEATEVRVAPQVGGRLLEVAVAEGDPRGRGSAHRAARYRRHRAGDAARRGRPRSGGRRAAAAAGRLRVPRTSARRGRRPSPRKADVQAAESELQVGLATICSASRRCSSPMPARASSATMRRRAATSRRPRVHAARERARAAAEAVARLRAGARAEEIAGARARVAVGRGADRHAPEEPSPTPC